MERRGADSLAVINELSLERYLLGVVPHEMPTSFGQMALEAQAITARSYAYNQFYANTYCAYGAHVTDTTASQVYLGYAENETAAQAVKATEGMCAVTKTGAVAQTYFIPPPVASGQAVRRFGRGRQLFRQGKILFAGADLRGFRAAADRGGMACLLAGLEETGVRYEFTVVSLEGVFQLWTADRNFAENSGGKRELQDRRESK